ncbi:MAG: branched-chain amino acid transport system II carrier protein [Endozoicomonas sp. (ex Botrylloides leachii)]|nr:branched-chain amino acid transport system II carrier protein [Endozoicomonas sp. (ex Botrylloides leachii)]
MKQQLSLQNLVGIGFMAFAMFLGAGNLIFPPLVGYFAGTSVWWAAMGFLITGVGLPFLGIVAISLIGGGFNEITRELPRWIIVLIGSCIFLIIGPLYAVPRTAMVAYEIGVIPFLGDDANNWMRLLFCSIFFALAWYLCLNPGKLLESVGKLITPALIILLLIIGLSPVFYPMGQPGTPLTPYTDMPFLTGFTKGYLTMDALAALMFGIVITANLKSHGITEKGSLVRYTVLTGMMAAIGLGLVYISLFYLGATTREMIPSPDNGGQILAIYVHQLLGFSGSIILALVVFLACFTTAVGCITATSEYFHELLNAVSYKQVVTCITLICLVIANLGLNQIVSLFIPVLFLLYPICISLTLLGLIRSYIPNPTLTYRSTLFTAFLFSLIDVEKSISFDVFKPIMAYFNFLPGFDNYMSWLLPTGIVFLISIIAGMCCPARKHV